MIRDWLLIAIVIGLVLVVFFLITGFISTLIEYWREYRDAGASRNP